MAITDASSEGDTRKFKGGMCAATRDILYMFATMGPRSCRLRPNSSQKGVAGTDALETCFVPCVCSERVTGTKLDVHAGRSNMSRHNSCFGLSISSLRCSTVYMRSRRLVGQVNEDRQGKLYASRWSQSKTWPDNADRGRLIVWSCLERHSHHSALTMSPPRRHVLVMHNASQPLGNIQSMICNAPR